MSILSRPAPAPIVYPDTDGEPMAENTIQYRYLTTIKGGLEVMFRDREDVFVAGDLFWYPVEGHPEIRLAPDVLVAVGRPKRDRPSYLQWLEGNHPPDVIFEILSPGNRPAEMIRKSLFYQHHGVREYYVYDPEDGGLWGWQRSGEEFREIPEMRGWVSPLLGIRFELEGAHLRAYDSDGQPFSTYEELAAERDQERARAEQERTRADQERTRAERFAALLREAGIEPPQ